MLSPPSAVTSSTAAAQTCAAAVPSRCDYLRASPESPTTSSSRPCAFLLELPRILLKPVHVLLVLPRVLLELRRVRCRDPLPASPEPASTIRWTRSSRAASSISRASSSISCASPCNSFSSARAPVRLLLPYRRWSSSARTASARLLVLLLLVCPCCRQSSCSSGGRRYRKELLLCSLC